MKYAPGIVPQNTEDLQAFLQAELAKISDTIDQIHIYEIFHAAPSRPVQGMTVYADGTDWNPGSGEGLYRYNGSSWNFLG